MLMRILQRRPTQTKRQQQQQQLFSQDELARRQQVQGRVSNAIAAVQPKCTPSHLVLPDYSSLHQQDQQQQKHDFFNDLFEVARNFMAASSASASASTSIAAASFSLAASSTAGGAPAGVSLDEFTDCCRKMWPKHKNESAVRRAFMYTSIIDDPTTPSSGSATMGSPLAPSAVAVMKKKSLSDPLRLHAALTFVVLANNLQHMLSRRISAVGQGSVSKALYLSVHRVAMGQTKSGGGGVSSSSSKQQQPVGQGGEDATSNEDFAEMLTYLHSRFSKKQLVTDEGDDEHVPFDMVCVWLSVRQFPVLLSVRYLKTPTPPPYPRGTSPSSSSGSLLPSSSTQQKSNNNNDGDHHQNLVTSSASSRRTSTPSMSSMHNNNNNNNNGNNNASAVARPMKEGYYFTTPDGNQQAEQIGVLSPPPYETSDPAATGALLTLHQRQQQQQQEAQHQHQQQQQQSDDNRRESLPRQVDSESPGPSLTSNPSLTTPPNVLNDDDGDVQQQQQQFQQDDIRKTATPIAAAAEEDETDNDEEQQEVAATDITPSLRELLEIAADLKEKNEIGSPSDEELEEREELHRVYCDKKLEIARGILALEKHDHHRIQTNGAKSSQEISFSEQDEQVLQEVFESLITDGDQQKGNVELVEALLRLEQLQSVSVTFASSSSGSSSSFWIDFISSKSFECVAAYDGSLQYLELFFNVLVPREEFLSRIEVSELAQNAMFSQSRRIPAVNLVLKLLSAGDKNKNIVREKLAQEIPTELQDFFADICSEAKAIPKEDRSCRMELIETFLRHPDLSPFIVACGASNAAGTGGDDDDEHAANSVLNVDTKEGNDAQTVLSRAAKEGDIALLEKIIGIAAERYFRVDINHVSSGDNTTALIQAVLANQVGSVKFLLGLPGIDISHKSSEGDALFLATALKRDNKIILRLKQFQQQQQKRQ